MDVPGGAVYKESSFTEGGEFLPVFDFSDMLVKFSPTLFIHIYVTCCKMASVANVKLHYSALSKLLIGVL